MKRVSCRVTKGGTLFVAVPTCSNYCLAEYMYNREWYRAGSGGDSVDDKRSCGMGWDRGQGRGRAAERRQSVSQLVNGEKKKEWERQREQARESVAASNTHYVGSVCCCWLCLPACWFWLYDCESAKPASQRPLGGVVEYFSVVVVALHVESWKRSDTRSFTSRVKFGF